MHNTHLSPSAGKQRGVALLIFLIALVMAASYALLKKVNQVPSDASRDTYTMQQLKIARDALRGYALHGLGLDPVTVTETVQPGRLPCPDYGTSGSLDGVSDPCIIVGTYVRPGRLPWRTLGLAELRDGDNEPLWYVPDIQFNGSVAINSNNTTTLRIDATADDIIAIVLSPGAVLTGQSRPSGNLTAQLDPARYFEDINALAATNYVTAPASSNVPFNDRLLTIRLNRFMPELEGRVLRELANLLGSPPYPAPAPIGSETCDIAPPPIDHEGLIPTICATAALPTFPSWFNDINEWQTLIWYAMDASGALIVNPSGTSTQALLFSPGAQLSGQNRTPVITSASDLLDDGVNTDGNTVYLEPINSPTNNDQLLILEP